MKLPAFFEEDRLLVEEALERLLPQETKPPPSSHQAMRYSVFAGGKRIRPILCLESARIFAADVTPILHPACALEFIHTYSLIHDDLPALDNDDLRRGKPTCHKQFGEANAILAGHAVPTLAFQTVGEAMGLLFQVTDDILDVEESSAALGKTAGKDMAQKKATYPAVFGLERSHQIAQELASRATGELEPYGERASRLRDIAEYLVL